MTQGVKDLIQAIVEGDAANIDAAFNAEMATRVSAKLEDMRVSVAQNMFATEQVNEEVEEDLEEEFTDEEVDALLESLTDDDINELVEEYEQLDELSKKTLGSYVKNATDSLRVHAAKGGNAINPRTNNELENQLKAGKRRVGIHQAVNKLTKEEAELDEASYSAKAARAGKDIGKSGKNFEKIAKKAGEKYGSAESGKRVAGAILAKMRAK